MYIFLLVAVIDHQGQVMDSWGLVRANFEYKNKFKKRRRKKKNPLARHLKTSKSKFHRQSQIKDYYIYYKSSINIYIYKISHSCKDEVSGVGAERDGGIANRRCILREIRAPRSSLCSTSSFHRIPTPVCSFCRHSRKFSWIFDLAQTGIINRNNPCYCVSLISYYQFFLSVSDFFFLIFRFCFHSAFCDFCRN